MRSIKSGSNTNKNHLLVISLECESDIDILTISKFKFWAILVKHPTSKKIWIIL